MTVEQTKIVVKSQKCSMSAERKSAGRTTPICSEGQPGVFGMSKKTYRWRPVDLRIAESQAANLRTGSRPAPDRGRARAALFSAASMRVKLF
jgi:precorrin-3B methylase